jgi:dTDP-4-dehydrorhamnose 3,5-epimerase
VLEDDSEVFYLMSVAVEPSAARGIRWNDPTLSIAWPLEDPILSARDSNLPLIGSAT